MWRELFALLAMAATLLAGCSVAPSPATGGSLTALPSPRRSGDRSVEEVLDARRSVREFADRPLERQLTGQLLWAAQGVTDRAGHRTAPSAGALYPLELYLLDASGSYRYVPAEHGLRQLGDEDLRQLLAAAAAQQVVADAPTLFVITGVEARLAGRYGGRAERYLLLEAGHAAQNLLLEATALELAAVPVGAFDDDAVARIMGLAPGERPVYLLPVGHPVDG